MTDSELKTLKDEIVKHTITRTHAFWFAAVTVIVSVAGAWGTYVTTISDIRNQIDLNRQDVETRIQALRLEREQHYVKKEDMKDVTQKLDRVITDLSVLHGFIQGQDKSNRK
jgi:hypothetical protein